MPGPTCNSPLSQIRGDTVTSCRHRPGQRRLQANIVPVLGTPVAHKALDRTIQTNSNFMRGTRASGSAASTYSSLLGLWLFCINGLLMCLEGITLPLLHQPYLAEALESSGCSV